MPWCKTAEINGDEAGAGRAADADVQSVDERDVEAPVARPEDCSSQEWDDQAGRGGAVISTNITDMSKGERTMRACGGDKS